MREWFVKETHGNAYQSGFPDVYATHIKYGMRWIEVKNPLQFSFTPKQVIDFPKFIANGTPIWVLGAPVAQLTPERMTIEYKKLFGKCNFTEYFVCFQDGCRNFEAWQGGRRS